MKNVVILGLMGQYPMGGMAWQVMHHIIGFERLGCRCYYVENSGAPPYSPRLRGLASDARENIRFLKATFRRFGFADRWSYFDCISKTWTGMPQEKARALLADADMIVNLCGASPPYETAARKGCLVYLETDPVREQFFLARGDPEAWAQINAHDVHFTYGWNVGDAGCPVPDGGVKWRKTHPPVTVDLWDSPGHPRGSWRTIATYQNFGKDLEVDGETYLWSKHKSFDRLIDLPRHTRERLELALMVDRETTRDRFVANGWKLVDAWSASRTAACYQRFIQDSKGEFSVEKDQVVRLAPGWFSDRTVSFLAAGRPCVIEDTGFGTRLPVGQGLCAWRSREEAIDAINRVAADYRTHARAARQLARDFFDTSVLLPPLLEAAGL